MDLELTRSISIPVEATYLVNDGAGFDDLSGLGVSTGMTFSF